MRPLAVALVILLACSLPAFCQDEHYCHKDLFNAVKTFDPNSQDIQTQSLTKFLSFHNYAACMVELIASSPQYQREMQNTPATVLNTLTQLGSSEGAGGTTNLVSKGLTPNLLSAAAGYGALSETTSNQTTTVSGSIGGLPVALLNHGVWTECTADLLAVTTCVNHRTISTLNRFSYGVSFDTSQNSQTLTGTTSTQSKSTTQPVTFTANTHQVNQIVAKAVLWQGHPVSSKDFIDHVNRDLNADRAQTDKLAALPKAQKAFIAAKKAFPEWQDKNQQSFETWRKLAALYLAKQYADSKTAGKEPDEESVAAWWKQLGCSLVNLMGGPQTQCPVLGTTTPAAKFDDLFKQSNALANAYAKAIAANYDYSDSLRASPIITFEYDDNRPVSQPSNSVFRLVLGKSINDWTFTANGTASIYNSAPSTSIPGAGRLRDFQLASQVDYKLSKFKVIGSGTSATLAYYYQDQTSPSIVNVNPSNPATGINFIGLPANAKQVFAKKGVINIAQAKFTIGTSQSGFSLPIAVSWSNRTELLTKSAWRGQVGLNYNFDSLFSGKSNPGQ
jgi:hypothetical protein